MSRDLPGLPPLPPAGGMRTGENATQGPTDVGRSTQLPPAGAIPRSTMSTGEMLATMRGTPGSARRAWTSAAAVVLVLMGLWWWNRPRWPGQVRIDQPEQIEVQAQSVEVRGFTLHPQASFAAEGVVVGRERYRLGKESRLSPYDIGIVWGVAAEPDMLRLVRYSQNSRFLWWRYSTDLPVGEDEMNRSMANIHTIPSNRRVRRQLGNLRPGHMVRLTGYLVRVEADGGWQWNSSMTRDDTGNGACEVMLVQAVERVDRRVGR